MTQMPKEPLVLDLDGTLFFGDSAWDNLRVLLLQKPLKLPELFLRSLRGRAALKCWLYEQSGQRAEALMMRPEVVKAVRLAKTKGRPVHLVSGAPQGLVDDTAQRLGLNLRAGHWGSRPGANLTYAKKPFLVKRFSRSGFDYFGDRDVDLPIFADAKGGAVVGARPAMV